LGEEKKNFESGKSNLNLFESLAFFLLKRKCFHTKKTEIIFESHLALKIEQEKNIIENASTRKNNLISFHTKIPEIQKNIFLFHYLSIVLNRSFLMI
jgi:hypothetical protein